MSNPYIQLTKPGIIQGNLIAAIGGFFFASQGNIDWLLLLAVSVGTSLIVASGSVFNNYIDRDIDSVMIRTEQRAMVRKLISPFHALLWGSALGILGFIALFFFTSLAAFAFGMLGFIVYVIFYSLYYKRHSVLGTLIGAFAGACPVAIGYCAVIGHVDITCAILFLIFYIWQIPHSYAIAIYHLDDYKAASIPVLPVLTDINYTRYHMMGGIIVFAIMALSLPYLGYAGLWYAFGMGGVSLYWLYLAKVRFKTLSTQQWGKQQMLCSIMAIMVFCLLISVDFVPAGASSSPLADLSLLLAKVLTL